MLLYVDSNFHNREG